MTHDIDEWEDHQESIARHPGPTEVQDEDELRAFLYPWLVPMIEDKLATSASGGAKLDSSALTAARRIARDRAGSAARKAIAGTSATQKYARQDA